MQLTAHELVAIVNRDGGKLCSGVAVGEDRVLTAAHCLAGADAIRRSDGSAVPFRVEKRVGHIDAAALSATIQSAPLACESGRWLLRSGRSPCPLTDATHVGCTPEPGDSGSPLVDCNDGRARVVGVLSGLRQRGAEKQVMFAAVRALEPLSRPSAIGIAGIAGLLALGLLLGRARPASLRKSCLR